MADRTSGQDEMTASARPGEGAGPGGAARPTNVTGGRGVQVGDSNIQHNTYVQAPAMARTKDRRWYLWGALAFTIMLLAGAFGYYAWRSPRATGQTGNEVIVDGTDVQVFPPYDQPGGEQTYEYPVVNSDMPVSLECYVSLPDGLWYQIYGDGGWIPRDAVHAIPGTAFPNPHHC